MLQDKEAEKAFFDQFGIEAGYDVFTERGYARLLAEFANLVRPRSQEFFLDIGCGTGAFTGKITAGDLAGVGVDLSINSLRFAGRTLNHINFALADGEQLPFRENSFDIVILSGVLHHLPLLEKILAESFRVLRPGGRLFGYDPNGRNPAMWLYRSSNSPLSSRKGWTINERLLRSEEIERSLREANFGDISCCAISGVTYKYVKSQIIRYLLTAYNAVDMCLEATYLSRLFGAFLISYARKPNDCGSNRVYPGQLP